MCVLLVAKLERCLEKCFVNMNLGHLSLTGSKLGMSGHFIMLAMGNIAFMLDTMYLTEKIKMY